LRWLLWDGSIHRSLLRSYRALSPRTCQNSRRRSPCSLDSHPLSKAKPGEVAALFDDEQMELERIVGRKLARWCRDNFAALLSCRPKMPSTAHNRLADNWRPLFAIAEVVGGDWPRLVLEAFMKLTARQNRDAQSVGVNLLNDIRQVFARSGRDRFHSKELVAALCGSADSPWSEAHAGKAITENWLCRQLRRFGIDSHNVRIEERQAKGFELGDFGEAFARFLGNGGNGEVRQG
jgi:putative DNA primase/helicase